MRVRLTLGLTDRPGSLLKALEQIAKYGGNIISIVHNRDRITGGYVPVSMNIDFPDEASLERSKAGIESVGIPVLESETLERRVETFLILGSSGVEDVIKHVEGSGARLVALSLSGLMPNLCLKLVVELPVSIREEFVEKLRSIVESSGSVLVREMDA